MSIGLVVALLSCLGGTFVIIQYLTNWTIIGFNPRNARGWTSLICRGILGEYLGRLFEEVKGRPIWLVKKRINVAAPERYRQSRVSG